VRRYLIFSLRGKIFSVLLRELDVRIPQFHPYGADYEMVSFVYRDLINWFKVKWNIEESHSVYGLLDRHVEEKSEELNAFLDFWLDRWLEKWRDRVKILQKKPQIPQSNLDRANKALKICRKMDQGGELKDILVGKLINQGEICMTEQIAENLILEEISKCLPRMNEPDVEATLNPVQILNNLIPRICKLHRERGPLVYLRIRTGPH